MGSRCAAWLGLLAAFVLLSSGCGTSGNNDQSSGGSSGQAGTVLCQPGLVACNGECVDVKLATAHCGTCGNACIGAAVCANGACTTSCAAGTQKCGDSCASLMTDAAHCGSCDKVCDAGVPCYGGVCGCPASTLFCQGQCHDPMSDAANCGACGTACTGGAACIDGKCSCSPGEQLCGTDCSNLNQPQHCGSCGKSCAVGEICAVTSCIPNTSPCPAGLTRCGDACVDLKTTAGSCGSCDTKCGGGQACSNGTCGCGAGKSVCGASCVDLTSSALNCGACGTVCSSGQTCQAGQCKCAEATDVVCDGACIDAQADVNHCGDCSTKCTGGLPCTDGKCQCPAGQTVCAGACVSTDSTPAHCGGCGMACPTGETCQAGKCSGSFGDSCTSTRAVGISIDAISVYQAGKIPVMAADKPVAKADRVADIIQGKPGRFRVFTKLESGWVNRTVSARLVLTNAGVDTKYFSKRNVNMASTENSFATTFNFDVKAEDFTATTHYSVEIVECDGTPAGTAGKARYPASEYDELITRQTGMVKVRFIPLSSASHTASVDTSRLDAYKKYVDLMYPTTGVQYTVGSTLTVKTTVSAQGDGWTEALDQISKLHESDNAAADTYYYGLLQPTDTLGQYCGQGCVAGIGYVTDTTNFSRHAHAALGLSFGDEPSAQTMAHEVGHNHGREHAPCGGAAQPDPSFPYAGAKIGWWGYQAPEKLYDPAKATDIMGYCDNVWASDYTYQALADRIARMNSAPRELPPPGGMHHYLFLLTDFKGPRWGLYREAPRYPHGEPEQADILDDSGAVITSVTVYRTPTDHLSGALILVPDPEPGWHAIQVRGAAPLPFGATSSSQ